MRTYKDDFIQYSDKKVKEETKNLAWYLTTHICVYIVLLFFLIFFTWYTVFISTHKFYVVRGPSMKETLNSSILDSELEKSVDAVYIDLYSNIELFDIVVIESPGAESVIKRVIAFEGDYVSIQKIEMPDGKFKFYVYRIPAGADKENFSDEDAKLDEESGELGYRICTDEWNYRNGESVNGISIDGKIYEEKFYNTFLKFNENVYTSKSGLKYVKVPEGKFFYMGDNRAHSTDARERGFGNFDDIVGRTEFIVYKYSVGNRIMEVIKFYINEMKLFFAR